MVQNVARRIFDAVGDRKPYNAEQIGSKVIHAAHNMCGVHESQLDRLCA